MAKVKVTWFETKRHEAEVEIPVETIEGGWRQHEDAINEALVSDGALIKEPDLLEFEIDHVEEIAKDQPVPSDVKAVRYVPEF